MSGSERRSGASRRRFEAAPRETRDVGVRDRVLVLPSVICSHLVADRIADRIPDAVSAPHDHGCAQLGADNDQTRRTLVGVGRNPNVSGTVVVGLGCEEVQSGDVAAELDAADVPVRELSIQEVGGTDACIEEGVGLVRELIDGRSDGERNRAALGDLTLGIVGSDLQRSTREVADPLVGGLADRVVEAGGRVVVAGIERFLPHRSELVDRANGEATAADVAALIDRHRETPSKDTRVRATAASSPFEEVSRVLGSSPIDSVIEYGSEASHDSGIALLDAPSRVEEATTGLAAAGAQVVVHATGDGIPTGHPIVPVLKVTGDVDTYDALSADIDVDAAAADVDDLCRTVLDVCGGTPCRAERHGLTEFAITRVGPSM
ncbi:UxaA family hydrolase [Halorarum salinum]|uniref:UxaA family hydrolase n=1 Tax=Halorarum salinum TaxID=2743089 RepID=A0A7D5L9E7_9EURY|nr:UxaA family hydrolase [Halobaculum salinum]QLG61154.1 UxaA family hydrolase [Halobaculum salinum]